MATTELIEPGFEVNPLANPKGVKLVCHLCQKPARIQCPDCRVTYYCTQEDQTADWKGIHSQVCNLLGSLKASVPHATSETERRHQRKRQQHIRDHVTTIALTESRKHLHNADYSLAFPPSLLALKLLTETHGSAQLQLTPALLLLAQSSMGQGQLQNAKQYLSQAHWAVVQNPDTPPSLHSQLHRNLGLLATAHSDYTTAKKQFAEDIYQSSVAHGPQSIQTVGGLYHLGNVFLKESKPSVALSFHEQVVKIWLDHLDSIAHDMIKAVHTPLSTFSLPGMGRPLDDVTTMNVAECVEAKQHLQNVLSLQEFHTLCSPPLTYSVYYSLALLYIVMKDYKQARHFINEAIKTGEEETVSRRTSVEELQELIEALEKNQLPDAQ